MESDLMMTDSNMTHSAAQLAANYRKAWTVVAWTYDADIHCPDCAAKRFAGEGDFDWSDPDAPTRDSEGNVPQPVFLSQLGAELDDEGAPIVDHCGDCLALID